MAASQPWILGSEQSGLLTHIAMMESVSLCVQMKLAAFMEPESALRGCGFLH
jgi:hypothetical protein